MRDARYSSWSRDLHTPVDKTSLNQRRLRILSALFKALEERGYKLTASEAYRRGVEIGLGHEKLEVSLEERIDRARQSLLRCAAGVAHRGSQILCSAIQRSG